MDSPYLRGERSGGDLLHSISALQSPKQSPKTPNAFKGSSLARAPSLDEYGKINRSRNAILAIIATFLLLVFMYGNLQSQPSPETQSQVYQAPGDASSTPGVTSTTKTNSRSGAAEEQPGEKEPEREAEPEEAPPAAAPTQEPEASAPESLDWKSSKQWVREQLEALAASELEVGWHGGLQQDGAPPQEAAEDADSSKSSKSRQRRLLADGDKAGGATSGRLRRSRAVEARNSDSERTSGGSAARASTAVAGQTALVAVTTTNVWDKTEKMLYSLAGCRDSFELLVIDEMSTDGTPDRLRELGVHVIETKKIQGVTANWNMAYKYWRKSAHEFMFIVNNDVLVPDGVLNSLMQAMNEAGTDCDLVAPLSTVRGKGWWGKWEGMEKMFNLRSTAGAFIQNPINYGRVQAVLDALPSSDAVMVKNTNKWHNKGFSGFFFGMRRSIRRAAFDVSAGLLFDPSNVIIRQEGDLFDRMSEETMSVCLHTKTFVYHYKGSTIGEVLNGEREFFRAEGR